ncbi:MAG: helix-turn-helix transcriptional regulator [Bacteroidales bacterium]|nr:helix-turn-helix domain-containing protein [Muribaculaceae bacterium]MDO4972481.1 helix-turn-helix transcriptional regulator [Bacteroidales bacterium]
MTIQDKFGIAIKRIRKQKNLSQEKFALEAGINRRYMSEIENGKANVTLDIIERITNYLNCSLADFFKELDNSNTPEL